MKCKYKFPVAASVRFTTGIKLEVDGHEYSLEVTDGRLTHISVTVPDFPNKYLPTFKPLRNQLAKAEIVIPEDPFRDAIIANIRAIEGGLCLWGLEEIDTEAMAVEWIPESKEETQRMELFSFSMSRGNLSDRRPRDAQIQMFARTISGYHGFSESEVPLNFFRRGKNDLREGRFIDAIYDFYFVLETLFANGKFHKDAVIREFCDSNELVEAIEHLKREINDPVYFPHDLKSPYQDRLRKSSSDVIKDLVEIRGFLHHHTLRRRGIWHPANQKEFRVDCIVLLNICQYVLSNRVNKHLFDERVFEEFLSKDVTTSEGQVINWIHNDEH